MAEKTGISWTDATFNPWWGCMKVSPACDHCYAERDAKRFAAGRVLWGAGSERRIFDVRTIAGAKHWKAPLTWAKTMPAKLGRRPRVFCASMADWLDLDAPIAEFVRLLDTIRQTPELDWLLLSKRIGNWRKRLEAALDLLDEVVDRALILRITFWLKGTPPPNVWLGATVINQEEADRDVPKLLAVPARVRFLSIEPMLGPVDMHDHFVRGLNGWQRLHWIIAGGESGPKARPAHPDWFRSLRDQCASAGVPFHFKQWGEWAPKPRSDAVVPNRHLRWSDVPGLVGWTTTPGSGGADVYHYGKAAAGRLLDGVEHNAFPEAA